MAKKATQQSTELEQPGEEPVSFEAALRELESIVTQMESGEMTLEISLALHERGRVLVSTCNTYLEQVDLRVRQLLPESI